MSVKASLKTNDTKASEDLVYYNASLYNPTNAPLPASISDVRGQNIIDYPEDWHMSVVRFDISSAEIPTAIVPMASTATGFQPSTLVATLRYLGIDYSSTVQIFNYPIDWSGGAPPAGSVFSYNELLTQINAAYAAAYALIPGPSSSAPPFFAMDGETNVIRCYFQDTYITAGNPISIIMNYPLYVYLFNLPHNRISWDPAVVASVELILNSGFTVAISGVDRSNFPRQVSLVNMPGAVNYVSQETQSLETWDAISSIFITTNSLPIQAEYLPTTAAPTQNQTFSSLSSQVISDFAVDTPNPLGFRQRIVYLPTAEYRMIHLSGRDGVKRIDAQFWYRTKAGIAYPINIPVGGSCGLKILFRRAHAHHKIDELERGPYRNLEDTEERSLGALGMGRRRVR